MRRQSPEDSSRDRGVSEVVAFTLVFAIIIGSVTVVYAFGLPAMLSYQESEQVQNAERASVAMAENFNDVLRYDGIVERSSEITLREGSLSTPDETTTLTIDGIEEEGWESDEVELGSLVYEHDDTMIAYQGGGVFRGEADTDGSVPIRQPKIACHDETGIISLVQIDADEPTVFSHEGREITIREQSTWTGTVDDPDISADSDTFDRGWELALERYGWGDCNADEALVRIVTVDVSY